VWQVFSGVIAGSSLGLIAVALRRLPDTTVRLPLYAFIAAGALWVIGDLIAGSATDVGWKLAGVTILYTGSITLPALWWMLALRWASGVGARLPLRGAVWQTLPLCWAAAMWLVMLSNPWHGAFITPVVGGRNVYHSLWFTMALPNYGLILAAFLVELEVFRQVRQRAVRRQALYLITASALTMGGNLLYVIEAVPLDFTVVVLSLSGTLLVVGMAREGLFGVLSTALPAIAASHPDGLVVVGPDGRVRYLNVRAERLLEPLAIREDFELLPTLQHSGLRPEAARLSETNDDWTWWHALTGAEGVLFRKSEGTPRWLRLSASRVERRGPRESGYCLRIADVSASRQAELYARQSRRLESVASVARSAAREFQSSLAIVEGNAQLLTRACENDAAAMRQLSRILEAAQEGTERAYQLQLHTGSVEARRASLDLAEIVVESCGLAAEELSPGLDLVPPQAERLLPVEADPIQLRQAVYGLLVNAIEAMRETPGIIGVEAGSRSIDPAGIDTLVTGREQPAGEYAFVRVRDEGGGLDADSEERAFEPYFSTRHKDESNVLATVLGIAKAHAAPLALENEPGRGCAFTLYLPLVAD
jgi:signal transduction histidine kinase